MSGWWWHCYCEDIWWWDEVRIWILHTCSEDRWTPPLVSGWFHSQRKECPCLVQSAEILKVICFNYLYLLLVFIFAFVFNFIHWEGNLHALCMPLKYKRLALLLTISDTLDLKTVDLIPALNLKLICESFASLC